MQASTDENTGGIPVRVYTTTGDVKRGMLIYREEGPTIILDNNEIIRNSAAVSFSFHEASMPKKLGMIDSEIRIILKPQLLTELRYSKESSSPLQMYPPSSGGWLTHVVDTGARSIFSVQRIQGGEKKVLAIVDKVTSELYFLGFIQSYELAILSMERDWNVHNEIIYSEIPDTDIYALLENESLSWSTLSMLVDDVTIPNLTMKETREKTLIQLVPKSFPPDTRRQIAAFFAWLESAQIPRADPIDFIMKYRSVGVFRALIRGHIQCLVDDVEPPKYVKLLQMADKGQLEITQRPYPEGAEQDLWNLVRVKLHETFPSWMGLAIENAIRLQKEKKIVTELPVSKELAMRSIEAWRNRFAMANHTLIMRGHVNKELLGLRPVLYVGAAHRWPHRHLEWSARLGYSSEKQQHIQVMVMPPSALERVSRIVPTVRPVEWEMSSFNLHLYNGAERKWKVKSSLLIKSLERRRSIRQLSNEFGKPNGKKPFSLSREQARALDLISWGIYLSSLETERYSAFYGMSNSRIKDELDSMLENGIFLLQYFLIPERLRSICVKADGPSGKICSMSRSFLLHTPSAQIRITDKGGSCIVVARIPESEYYNLITALADVAYENEVSLGVFPISAYTGYRNDLYSRLLRDDGSWDDDVSGLLSQVRLPPRDAV